MRAAGSYRRAIIARPPETARGVAAAESQMAILQREVFLMERLDQEGSDQLMHMKAVCLVSPAGRLHKGRPRSDAPTAGALPPPPPLLLPAPPAAPKMPGGIRSMDAVHTSAANKKAHAAGFRVRPDSDPGSLSTARRAPPPLHLH